MDPVPEPDMGFLIGTRSGTNKLGSESKPDMNPEPLFRNGLGSGSNMVPTWNRSVYNPKPSLNLYLNHSLLLSFKQ